MPRVGHERTRICHHADETREQAEVRKRVELPLDSFLLIEKPPGGAELNFPWNRPVLKVANQGSKHVIVRRIVVVKNRLRQSLLPVELVQISRQGRGLRKIANGIKARVRPKPAQPPRVVVAQRANMQLL